MTEDNNEGTAAISCPEMVAPVSDQVDQIEMEEEPMRVQFIDPNAFSIENAVETLTDMALEEKDFRKELYRKHHPSEKTRSKKSKKKAKKQRKKILPNADEFVDSSAEVEKMFDAAWNSSDAEFADENDELSTFNKIDAMLAKVEDVLKAQVASFDCDKMMSFCENISILVYQVYRAQSGGDVVVALLSYMKKYTSRSIVKTIFDVIKRVTLNVAKKRRILPNAVSGQSILDAWSLFRTNTMWTNISFLITAAMTLTACESKKIEWNLFGLEILCLEAQKEQIKAVDFLDAALNTLVWICTTGMRVIEENSIAPLLYCDQRTQKFNEMSDWVFAHADHILMGNFDSSSDELGDLDHKLNFCLQEIGDLKAACPKGPSAIWLQKKFERLIDISQRVRAKKKNSQMRFQPYGVALVGSSRIGKSVLSETLMKILLKALGFEYDPKRVISKDMFDKYDSTMTSDVLGLFMDDLGVQKPDQAPEALNAVIIKFLNNVAAQAVKAELAGKGQVFVDPKCVIATSNFPDLGIGPFTDKPEAAMGRFDHVHMEVRPEFRKNDSVCLDPTKVPLGADLADVWSFDILETRIYKGMAGIDQYELIPKIWKSRPCTGLHLQEFLLAMIHFAQTHSNNQKAVLERSARVKKMVLCETCFFPTNMCLCTPKCCPESGKVKELVIPNSVSAEQCVKIETPMKGPAEHIVDSSVHELQTEVCSNVTYPRSAPVYKTPERDVKQQEKKQQEKEQFNRWLQQQEENTEYVAPGSPEAELHAERVRDEDLLHGRTLEGMRAEAKANGMSRKKYMGKMSPNALTHVLLSWVLWLDAMCLNAMGTCFLNFFVPHSIFGSDPRNTVTTKLRLELERRMDEAYIPLMVFMMPESLYRSQFFQLRMRCWVDRADRKSVV